MKKKILTASVLSSSLLLTSSLGMLSSCSKGNTNEFHILSINDIHGAIPGYGEDAVEVSSKNPGCLRLQKEASKILNKYPGSIFVSAGDENSGESWSTCDHAYTTYPVLKSMGIRYAAVGNHAFEWGLDDMASEKYDSLARTDETKGHYFITSNILNTNLYNDKEWCIDESNPQFAADYSIWQNQRVNWADPYKIVKMGDYNVCLIGLTTNKTLVDGNRRVTQQLSFIDYNASVNYTKHLIKEEKGKKEFDKINSFILLTHVDSDYTNNILTGEAVDLAATIDTDIDAIISAHSHKQGCGKIWNNKLNKSIAVGQANTAGRALLDTKLVFDKDTNKLTSCDMQVITPSVPKTLDEAKKDWNNMLDNPSKDLKTVANAYKQQKQDVIEKMGEKIGEVTLTDQEMQHPDKLQGYYNWVKDPEQTGAVGHDFLEIEAIVDHFGAWFNRAQIIGFDMCYWDEVSSGKYPAPSCGIISLDSVPTNLKKGDITIQNMYDQQPHDNTVCLGYLSIQQIGALLNYNLSGKPNGPDIGFNYQKPNWYETNTMYYHTSDNKSVEICNHKEDKAKSTSSKKHYLAETYYCNGIQPWWGIQANLVKITEGEKLSKFQDPITGDISLKYDNTATYRVADKEFTVFEGTPKEETIYLPDIKVFDSSTNNYNEIDNPNSESWHDAGYWYEKEHDEDQSGRRLIPMLLNNFSYDGGNGIDRQIKQYMQYNVERYGSKFEVIAESLYTRDLVETFCRYSSPNPHEWTEFSIPTDISWKNCSKQITIKE